MVLAFSMFTDIAEYIDWRSDQQMTALVLSASIFVVKIGAGLGSGLPGLVLQITGYVPGEAQSAQALAGINLAFAIIPVAILVPSGIALYFYRLDHRTMAQVESDLAARRTEM